MCGITGAVWNDPRLGLDEPQLLCMTRAIRHRGPDDEGTYLTEYPLRPPY